MSPPCNLSIKISRYWPYTPCTSHPHPAHRHTKTVLTWFVMAFVQWDWGSAGPILNCTQGLTIHHRPSPAITRAFTWFLGTADYIPHFHCRVESFKNSSLTTKWLSYWWSVSHCPHCRVTLKLSPTLKLMCSLSICNWTLYVRQNSATVHLRSGSVWFFRLEQGSSGLELPHSLD